MTVISSAAAAAATVLVVGVTPAQAAPGDAFYTPPAQLPSASGAIVKTRPTPIFPQIPGNPRPFPGAAQTVMYTSRLQDGSPTAVTGTYVEPFAPWRGRGPRPTVVMAPGTIGQGDDCAPSKLAAFPVSLDTKSLALGTNYEIIFTNLLLSQGYRILLTDYIGMGTPGIHTYVNRVEEGHAVLDGARAALNLAKLPAGSPVGFWGYSQGGGAAASAAEMASSYAPELNIKGTYAGAPPADLLKVLPAVDGSALMGVAGYAINSLVARYPDLRPILDREVNAAGKRALATLSTTCAADTLLRFPFRRTSEWSVSGRSLIQIAQKYPQVQEALAEQQIGNRKPNAPVLVDTGINDDIIPHGQVLEMVRSWRAQGAEITVINDGTPPILSKLGLNHGVPALLGALPAAKFLSNRFNS